MVVFYRHAQSTFNAYGDRSKNVPVTDRGRMMCSAMKGEYDLVICSNMRRTRQTLDHSKIVYKDVLFTDLCRERLDGTPGDYYNGEDIRLETEQEFTDRVEKFKQLIKQKQSEGYNKIAVISHYTFLKKITGFGFGNCQWMTI